MSFRCPCWELQLSSLFGDFHICNFVLVAFIRGPASTGEEELIPMWKDCSIDLKDCLGSIVVPIGNLPVGLCRHRALLFKVDA